MNAYPLLLRYDPEWGQLGLAGRFIALNKLLENGHHANRGVGAPLVQLLAVSTTRLESDTRRNGVVVAR